MFGVALIRRWSQTKQRRRLLLFICKFYKTAVDEFNMFIHYGGELYVFYGSLKQMLGFVIKIFSMYVFVFCSIQ